MMKIKCELIRLPDVDNKIKIDGIIGVSAGALFGVNYNSKQIGRVLRYNKKYAN